MMVAGIDFSITCPSICVYNQNDGDFSFKHCKVYFNQQNIAKKEQVRRDSLSLGNIFWSSRFETQSDEERYYLLADWALSILINEKVEIVSLEAYALGAKGRIFNIAEATGILKSYMMTQGIKIHTYAPTLNKKLFSGKGNAGKDVMIAAFNEKNGINISEEFGLEKCFTGSPISDIVDSYSLIETFLKERNII